MPSATTIGHPPKPHINGEESGLDGSVPDLRNRYFSFNLPLFKPKSFCYLVHIKIETNTKHKNSPVRAEVV